MNLVYHKKCPVSRQKYDKGDYVVARIIDGENKNLIGKFIADIVLQILSFVAENERTNIKQRQAEGIRIAKEQGVKFGRPNKKLPSNFKEVARQYLDKKISFEMALEKTKMTKSTFYKYIKLENN